MGKRKSAKRYIQDDDDFLEIVSQNDKATTEPKLIPYNLHLKCKTDNQKRFLKLIEENDLTVCLGEAGCGKTLLMCYSALRLLQKNTSYKKILLVKSVTELKGEELGTLPGNKDEKVFMFMMSYLDSFYKLIGEAKTKQLIENGTIVFEPIAYARGRNFESSIVCIDEAQNISKDNLKTLMTRLSENSKYVVTGDIGQIDLRHKSESGLEFFYEKIKNNPTEGVGCMQFETADIARHRLTPYILSLFNSVLETKK